MAAGKELNALRKGSGRRGSDQDALEVDAGWQGEVRKDGLKHGAGGLADGEEATDAGSASGSTRAVMRRMECSTARSMLHSRSADANKERARTDKGAPPGKLGPETLADSVMRGSGPSLLASAMVNAQDFCRTRI